MRQIRIRCNELPEFADLIFTRHPKSLLGKGYLELAQLVQLANTPNQVIIFVMFLVGDERKLLELSELEE